MVAMQAESGSALGDAMNSAAMTDGQSFGPNVAHANVKWAIPGNS